MLSFPLWPLGQLVLFDTIYIIALSYFPKQDGCAEIAPGKSRWPVVILRLSGGVQVALGQPCPWTRAIICTVTLQGMCSCPGSMHRSSVEEISPH